MKLKYPILAKLKDYGNAGNTVNTVVLFRARCRGTVIKSRQYPFAHFSKNWIPVDDEDAWKILDSKKSIIK